MVHICLTLERWPQCDAVFVMFKCLLAVKFQVTLYLPGSVFILVTCDMKAGR